MSPGPIGPTPNSGGVPSTDDHAAALRAIKAARQFQALFLMELMKPLTEELKESPFGGDSGLGLSSGSDAYSLFWNEGLAGQLAASLPWPELPGSAAPGSTAGLSQGVTPLERMALRAPLPPAIEETGPPAEPAAFPQKANALDGAVPIEVPRVQAPADATAAPVLTAPKEVADLMEKAGKLFSLPVNLVRAVVSVESGGRSDAVSSEGAVGLMQLMPQTAAEMGVKNPRDPWENLVGGARYLARQLERFGRVDHALAAYNAGPGAVEAHNGIPPYRETRDYIRRVLAAKARLDSTNPDGA